MPLPHLSTVLKNYGWQRIGTGHDPDWTSAVRMWYVSLGKADEEEYLKETEPATDKSKWGCVRQSTDSQLGQWFSIRGCTRDNRWLRVLWPCICWRARAAQWWTSSSEDTYSVLSAKRYGNKVRYRILVNKYWQTKVGNLFIGEMAEWYKSHGIEHVKLDRRAHSKIYGSVH